MASLFKKSKDKIKSGESVVGKIIYIFLLFAPLFSILTTCFYVMFNKNAFESYYGETINEKQVKYQEQNQDYKIETERYYLDLVSIDDYTSGSYNLYVKNFKIEAIGTLTTTQVQNIENRKDEILRILFSTYNNAPSIQLYYYEDGDDSSHWLISMSKSYASSFSFNITGYSGNLTTIKPKLYYYEYNKYSYLDNAFDYSLYKVEQNNIFNWSKTTGMYQILQTTCNGLGITNTFTPMLLSYWLVISVIYFIYDIALMLVWIMHRKIHELQESI